MNTNGVMRLVEYMSDIDLYGKKVKEPIIRYAWLHKFVVIGEVVFAIVETKEGNVLTIPTKNIRFVETQRM